MTLHCCVSNLGKKRREKKRKRVVSRADNASNLKICVLTALLLFLFLCYSASSSLKQNKALGLSLFHFFFFSCYKTPIFRSFAYLRIEPLGWVIVIRTSDANRLFLPIKKAPRFFFPPSLFHLASHHCACFQGRNPSFFLFCR